MRVRVLGEGPRTEFGNRCCASRPGTGEAVRPIDSSLRGNILDARRRLPVPWLAWLPAMPSASRAVGERCGKSTLTTCGSHAAAAAAAAAIQGPRGYWPEGICFPERLKTCRCPDLILRRDRQAKGAGVSPPP